jgi:hypothetical protein
MVEHSHGMAHGAREGNLEWTVYYSKIVVDVSVSCYAGTGEKKDDSHRSPYRR